MGVCFWLDISVFDVVVYHVPQVYVVFCLLTGKRRMILLLLLSFFTQKYVLPRL